MKTIFRESAYGIVKLFYNNRNKNIHLREIARKLRLNESTVSSRLNELVKAGILTSEKDANLKKFRMKKKAAALFFPFYDEEKLEQLPLLRKNAVKEYLDALEEKPLLMVVFGSTARGNFTEKSDIDILEIRSRKTDSTKAKKHSEAITGIHIQVVQMTEKEFAKEMKEKNEPVIQSALETGFPVFNQKYFYEAFYE